MHEEKSIIKARQVCLQSSLLPYGPLCGTDYYLLPSSPLDFKEHVFFLYPLPRQNPDLGKNF